MEIKALTLEQAESELDVLIDAGDETGWARVAVVLGEVERDRLWAAEKYHSFSAWIRSYAQRKRCSESLLWKYVKAGKAWASAREAAPGLPPIEEARVSAEVVATAEKIYGADAARVAKLVGEVQAGRKTSREVREMWKAARKVTGVRTSRHSPKVAAAGGDAEMTRKLTAALAAAASTWIWGAESKEEAESRKRENAGRDYLMREAVCVKVLTEFPVRVESAERARRIDVAAVCVENQTTADWMDVVLRGVEVKVSSGDLKRDQKMVDYSLFMDYMSVAVPAGLVGEAQDVVPAEWGVIAYDPAADRVEVVREPERLDAPRREQALMTAVVKLSRRESK